LRVGGGTLRVGGAPLVSPDGTMILFTEEAVTFDPGDFYTIQAMAGLPEVPPGRVVVGQGYNLAATPGAPLLSGSISFQYLANDVLVASADERDLTIYFWDGTSWEALDTLRNPAMNLVSAYSQGPGVYALMASAQIPLTQIGWNLISYPFHDPQSPASALASILGSYTLVYGYDAEDAPDPWKVYAPDPGVPGWVNDLEWMEFGHGYWVQATQVITIYMSAPTMLEAPAVPLPPATFYGTVQEGMNFAPVAGQTVLARIGSQVCGQGVTRLEGGQVVYVVKVAGEGEVSGCGVTGRPVSFEVGGKRMSTVGEWDNSRLWLLNLDPTHRLFLPLVWK
jgi:hypothetical protein